MPQFASFIFSFSVYELRFQRFSDEKSHGYPQLGHIWGLKILQCKLQAQETSGSYS
ncbi:unnamed protein product [Lupinus luteus]|uniref:Uncharacterized protein n=1 Tax=Lupinus luteus TaxID=3873 RepID=A0AAV1XNN7_LUPLU